MAAATATPKLAATFSIARSGMTQSYGTLADEKGGKNGNQNNNNNTNSNVGDWVIRSPTVKGLRKAVGVEGKQLAYYRYCLLFDVIFHTMLFFIAGIDGGESYSKYLADWSVNKGLADAMTVVVIRVACQSYVFIPNPNEWLNRMREQYGIYRSFIALAPISIAIVFAIFKISAMLSKLDGTSGSESASTLFCVSSFLLALVEWYFAYWLLKVTIFPDGESSSSNNNNIINNEDSIHNNEGSNNDTPKFDRNTRIIVGHVEKTDPQYILTHGL